MIPAELALGLCQFYFSFLFLCFECITGFGVPACIRPSHPKSRKASVKDIFCDFGVLLFILSISGFSPLGIALMLLCLGWGANAEKSCES